MKYLIYALQDPRTHEIRIVDQHGTEYKSITEAAKIIGCNNSAISAAMKENRSCKGFYFRRM